MKSVEPNTDKSKGPRVAEGPLRRLWGVLTRPSARASLGALLVLGAVVGWGGTLAGGRVLDHVSTNAYCTSCHEMKAFVFPDHRVSSHFSNGAGVRAQCTDCHPTPYYAFKDLIANWQGTIATRELHEAKRLELSKRVWMRMERSRSRACKSCHSHEAMNVHEQRAEAATMMAWAQEDGTRTCISCHKGVAHSLADGWDGR